MKRFGIPTEDDAQVKKAARLARFGNLESLDTLVTDAKKAERLEKFGPVDPTDLKGSNKKRDKKFAGKKGKALFKGNNKS
jgi:hypothetical protein